MDIVLISLAFGTVIGWATWEFSALLPDFGQSESEAAQLGEQQATVTP